MAEEFKGFYLHLLKHKIILDLTLWKFYRKLAIFLDMFSDNIPFPDIRLDMDTANVVTFTLDTMDVYDNGKEKIWQATNDDFMLCKGAYIQPFRDGTILYRMLTKIMSLIGEDTLPWYLKLYHFMFAFAKDAAHLRTLGWIVDQSLLARLPVKYSVAFAVDCVLYSEDWCYHQNYTCLHMLAVAWMLGAKEFDQFIPKGMQSTQGIADPKLKVFLDTYGEQLDACDNVKASSKK